MRALGPFDPEPHEPEPWPNTTPPATTPWYDGTVPADVSQQVGHLGFGVEHVFLTAAENRQESAWRDRVAERNRARGFSVGF